MSVNSILAKLPKNVEVCRLFVNLRVINSINPIDEILNRINRDNRNNQKNKNMEEELKSRTKLLAADVWMKCNNISNDIYDYKRQLIRCSSSVGANYRAACRAKSKADFLNKLKIVEEELDETMFFIELILILKPDLENEFNKVYSEAEELLKIMVKSIGTVRKSINK